MRASIFDCETFRLDCETFRLDEYEHYDKLHYGDINWIVPGKLLAFSGPQRERVILDGNGRTTLLAHEYAKLFTTLGVGCVVRFNEPTTYDRHAFTHANIRHVRGSSADFIIWSDES
jgi:cell division cycle 14